MKKTLWTVDYAVLGQDKTSRRHFESKADAIEFAARDYADALVRRIYTAEQAVELLKLDAETMACNEMYY